jgi:hypothetical protein
MGGPLYGRKNIQEIHQSRHYYLLLSIQTCSKFLAILLIVEDNTSELAVWNWKIGELFLVILLPLLRGGGGGQIVANTSLCCLRIFFCLCKHAHLDQ